MTPNGTPTHLATAAPGTDARDRAVGALLGLATGDAVGTTLEFARPGSFTPITDLVGGGPFGLDAGQWTDDTSMALCLAESLVDLGHLDLTDQLRRYVRWRDHGHLSSIGRCFDIGTTTTGQLDRFLRTGDPVDPHIDQDAAANGSLMRLAPVPIRWHTDLAEAADRSAESSRSTHAADRPVDACRVLGAMVAALVAGHPASDVFHHDFWRYGPLHPEVEAVARGSWRHREPPTIKGSGYCVAALEAAIWAVAGATDFRAAVLRAANLGDDADTTAAIAGQLAGARWGAAGIPEEWRARITLADRIVSLADRLFTDATREGPTTPWPHDEAIHGWWVDPGRVLAGEYPGARDDPARTRAKVDILVDAGVRTFVDLTEATEGLAPYDHVVHAAGEARGLDLRHQRFPIVDQSILPDDRDYDPVLRAIRHGTDRGVVFVHCWGGIGRTGTVVGCLLVDDGHDPEAALGRLRQLRAATRKAHRAAPENGQQEAVVRRRVGSSGT
jgi:ADP-ribosylglycohydrolase